MDKFDQQILQQLRQNARQSVSDIAAAVHLSRSAVTERIRKLEQQKVILGYQVVLRAATEARVRAYFELQHKAARCQELIPFLRSFSELKSCHGISGEVDLMLFVEADSMERLHQIREQIDAHPDIIRIRTHMVMSQWFTPQTDEMAVVPA
ncbi:Lrp/AsnC family transcriptional regulator [Rheinheimera sp. F8]|uniref:Lrp/AsnC family transcriptional regulator n=1 Tax=Rheinheimera sp. F8 TaxID=1763998 RepID=UPI0007448412|nr:Lrp/AsnC family transcriptional regulator [Rheinheimera sp. F8]ALZ74719.1 AsnC family transcriptional regulator [Rheinheimera sp. F8]